MLFKISMRRKARDLFQKLSGESPRAKYAPFIQEPPKAEVVPVPHLFRCEGKNFQRASLQGDHFVIEQGEILPDGDQRVIAVIRLTRSTTRLVSEEAFAC